MGRRLAAILAADVVGYSRLMNADEAATLGAVKNCLEEFIEPTITEHEGRVVKLMGDGLLAEFSSAVQSVLCAAELQKAMKALGQGQPEEKRIRLRIGVNLGDIIAEGGDIYGDGVNIAARLEALAEAEGVCVSGTVFDQVRNKVPLAFEDMGQRQVKNIPEPLRLYRLVVPGALEERAAGDFEAEIGLDFSVPDYPSIAVLPFTVMSEDPDQEFFADGVTEDIITARSKISRNLRSRDSIAVRSVFSRSRVTQTDSNS